MFLQNLFKRSIKQHAASLESMKVKLDKKFKQDPNNEKSFDEATSVNDTPRKKKKRKFSRSEMVQWDGPVCYRIPENFKDMYQDALKKKVEVTTLEADTLKAILKHKKNDPIQEFKDRYKRPGAKKRTKDSTPVKKPIGTNVKKRRKQETNSYTENDLKLNWKTLMCFCKCEWNEEEAYPLPKAEIEKDDRDFYYIGRSDIDGKKVYLSVSEHIIPTDKDSHILPTSFFLTMQNNEEYEIPDYSKKELYEIVQYAIRTSIDYIIPRMVKGEKKWKLRYKDGQYSKYMTKEWVDEKFGNGFDVF